MDKGYSGGVSRGVRVKKVGASSIVGIKSVGFFQCFGSGSGSVLDPYSIGPLDPDPDPYFEYGSGSGVLDGLFCELEASSLTWTYFMEA